MLAPVCLLSLSTSDHIAQIIELLGKIPPAVAFSGKFSSEYFSPRGRSATLFLSDSCLFGIFMLLYCYWFILSKYFMIATCEHNPKPSMFIIIQVTCVGSVDWGSGVSLTFWWRNTTSYWKKPLYSQTFYFTCWIISQRGGPQLQNASAIPGWPHDSSPTLEDIDLRFCMDLWCFPVWL